MNDIQMAIGLTQMKKLPKIIELKQKNYNLYCELLDSCSDIEIIKPKSEVSPFIPFRVVFRVKGKSSEKLAAYMKENGIETRSFFYPLHMQPCYKLWSDDERHSPQHFKVSRDSYSRGICLPSFAALKKEEIAYVCDIIKRFYKEN